MLVSSSRIPHLGRLLPPQEVREGFPKRLVGCRDVSVPKITGAHRSGRPREGGVTLLRQLRSWKADLRQHPRVSPRWKRRLASRHPSPGVTFLEAPRRQHPTAPPAAARRAGPAADPDKARCLRLSHQTHAGFLPKKKRTSLQDAGQLQVCARRASPCYRRSLAGTGVASASSFSNANQAG